MRPLWVLAFLSLLALAFANCGNGIVELGEQCDPPNHECCSKHCKFVTESEHHICRPAKNICHKAEHCNGRHAFCPVDVHQDNGLPCAKYMTCCDGECQPAGDRCPRHSSAPRDTSTGYTDMISHHAYRVAEHGPHQFGKVIVDPLAPLDLVTRHVAEGEAPMADLNKLHLAQTPISAPQGNTYAHAHPHEDHHAHAKGFKPLSAEVPIPQAATRPRAVHAFPLPKGVAATTPQTAAQQRPPPPRVSRPAPAQGAAQPSEAVHGEEKSFVGTAIPPRP